MSDLFNGVGILVDIKNPDNFLKIAETLTRIGVASKEGNNLYQSCHILHKRNPEGVSHYAIVHFKEMFELDGKTSNISEVDYDRLYLITTLLEQWNLVTIIDKDCYESPVSKPPIKVIAFKDKTSWTLVSKYQIGKKKNDGQTNQNQPS